MAGSLIAAAGIRNPNINERSSLTTSGAITFSGNVALLWNESLPGGLVYVSKTDDMDGDKKGDMILMVDNESTGVDIHTAIAKKGIDGTDLWRESTSIDVDEFSVIPTDDLNGDKKADVLVTIYDSNANNNTLIVKKGNDGTNLWQESVTGWIAALPTDDLNGDKKPDVLVYLGGTLIAKNGSDGTDLWKASSIGGIWGIPIGDLDRDGRENTLVSSYETIYAIGIPK